MGKFLRGIFFLGLIIFLVSIVLKKMQTQDTISIKKLENGHFQLLVNKEPYIIKGVVYNPVPIGKNYTYEFWTDTQKPYMYDGKLMKAMGVNTIRVYQPSKDDEKTKQGIRSLFDKFRIRVAVGHWLGFWENPNYADPSFREKVQQDVLNMVETYKNEKGILVWILGNENNVSFSYGPQTLNLWTTPEIDSLGDPYLKRIARARIYYSFVNEIAKEIHKIDPNHPVVLANAELTDIEVAKEVSTDIDILGCSIYRGKSFGSFFRQADMKIGKPVIITEFGCDSYNTFLNKEDDNIQSEFITAQWLEIEKNTYEGTGTGNSLGGFVFEWTDEWWKSSEDNNSSWYVHDTIASWSNGAYYFDIKAPQNLNINEEWWGICGLERQKQVYQDKRVPRKVYFALKEMWRR